MSKMLCKHCLDAARDSLTIELRDVLKRLNLWTGNGDSDLITALERLEDTIVTLRLLVDGEHKRGESWREAKVKSDALVAELLETLEDFDLPPYRSDTDSVSGCPVTVLLIPLDSYERWLFKRRAAIAKAKGETEP